jgi:hypothetical protein
MILENLTRIFLAASSILIGAILGILRSKIFASKSSNTLYYIFYWFAGIIFVCSIASLFLFSDGLFYGVKPDYFAIAIIILALLSSLALFFFSRRFLVFKNIYKAAKLDPIVNKFTSNADTDEIKLFGGDLNFFGNDPAQMDVNSQYTHLRARGFKKVYILCVPPTTSLMKIRYGKIFHELQGVEIGFYDPEKADLKVRGRIIKIHGVNKLLMYNRVRSGVYEAIETDLANSNGVLNHNIWELVWSLAKHPTPDEIKSWINLYQGHF